MRPGLPIAALAGFVALVLLLGSRLGHDPRALPSPLVGQPAPPLDLPSLDDPSRRVSLGALRGSPVLVNVWASWCVSCRAEHALLVELARSGRARILGLNYKDAREDAQRWLADLGNPYDAIAWDGDGRTGIDWGVYGVPETFVVDASGVVRLRHAGPIDERVFAERIAPLLGSGGQP